MHRIGRTGRAGASVIAIAFCDEEERSDWKNIEKLTGMKIPKVDGHQLPMEEEGLVRMNLPKHKAVIPRANAVVHPRPKKRW